jgi:hypothetical protein
MTALDWAEENDHMDVAELLSRSMNPTVTPSAAGENAFDEANPIDEVCIATVLHACFRTSTPAEAMGSVPI